MANHYLIHKLLSNPNNTNKTGKNTEQKTKKPKNQILVPTVERRNTNNRTKHQEQAARTGKTGNSNEPIKHCLYKNIQ